MEKYSTKVDFEKISFSRVYRSESVLRVELGHEKSKNFFLRVEAAKTIAIVCTWFRKVCYAKIYNKS